MAAHERPFNATVLQQYLDGATPIRFGPRPLNNARTPSVLTIFLQYMTIHDTRCESVSEQVIA